MLAAMWGNQTSDLILPLMLLAPLLVGLIILGRWASQDARRRGKSPTLVCLVVVLFFPWGLFAWVAFRPDVQTSNGKFDLDKYRLQ